jgi:hypothetical protein
MELASKHNVNLAVSLTAILLVSGIQQWHGIGLNNATSNLAEPLTAMSSEQQQQQTQNTYNKAPKSKFMRKKVRSK